MKEPHGESSFWEREREVRVGKQEDEHSSNHRYDTENNLTFSYSWNNIELPSQPPERQTKANSAFRLKISAAIFSAFTGSSVHTTPPKLYYLKDSLINWATDLNIYGWSQTIVSGRTIVDNVVSQPFAYKPMQELTQVLWQFSCFSLCKKWHK